MQTSQRLGEDRCDKTGRDPFCLSDNLFEKEKIIGIHELSGQLGAETMVGPQFLGELFWHSGKVLPEPFKSVLADLNRRDIGLRIHSSSPRPWTQIDSGPVRVCSSCFFWNPLHSLPGTLYDGPQTVFRILETICYDNKPIKISTSKLLSDRLDTA